MKLARELIASILLIVLSITSFILTIFQMDIPIYIISILTILLTLYLVIMLKVNYEIDFGGILLICFSGFVIISQIIFLFAYNNFVWAIKTLKIMVYVLYEIFGLIFGFGTGMGKIQDISTLNACMGCFLIIFVVLYIFNIKKYTTDK